MIFQLICSKSFLILLFQRKNILVYIQLLELRSENENLKSLLESEQKSSKLKYNELEDKLQVQF